MTSVNRSFYTSAVATEHYLGIRWPRAVWQAVLEQAITDLVEGPTLAEVRGMEPEAMKQFRRDIQVAAQCWIDDEANEPRRFVWVCEQLDLDPQAVRVSIERRLQE